MKYIYTFLIISALIGKVEGQITLQSTDMPALGDTLRYSTSASDVTTLIGQSGASQSWDATGLVPDFQDIAHFKSALNISILYAASFSGSSYGTEGASLNLQLVQGTDGYNFYKNGTGGFIQNGRGISLQGLPLSQTWNDTVLRFPLNYGDKDSNHFMSNEVNAILATMVHVGKRVNEVDGWGTLMTPNGTINCLRVKSTIRTVDTLKITQIPFPIPIPQNTIEYKWYAKSRKIPVLEIDVTTGTNASTTIKYRDITRPEVFLNQASFSANKTTFMANSSTDTCIITDNSLHPATSRTWTITPSTGFTYTGGTNSGSNAAKIFFTTPGLYTVKLHVVYNAGADDSTIVNYITVKAPMIAAFQYSPANPTTNQVVTLTDQTTGNPTSWKWYIPTNASFVNGTSSTSQNPALSFSHGGNYIVKLTAINGADSASVSDTISIMSTGLAEQMSKSIALIYPNPASTSITVELTNAKVANLELMDITGKILAVSSTENMSVANVANGYYMLRITTKEGNVMAKGVQVMH